MIKKKQKNALDERSSAAVASKQEREKIIIAVINRAYQPHSTRFPCHPEKITGQRLLHVSSSYDTK